MSITTVVRTLRKLELASTLPGPNCLRAAVCMLCVLLSGNACAWVRALSRNETYIMASCARRFFCKSLASKQAEYIKSYRCVPNLLSLADLIDDPCVLVPCAVVARRTERASMQYQIILYRGTRCARCICCGQSSRYSKKMCVFSKLLGRYAAEMPVAEWTTDDLPAE